MAKSPTPNYDPQWAKAKNACRLNQEDIRMAKELGLSPKSLMKSKPNQAQRWKLPVKLWIRELHAKRFGRQPEPVPKSVQPGADGDAISQVPASDEDIPF